MLKVMVACGCGMGSSQMLKMKAAEVFKELGIEVTIHHTSVDEAMSTANEYDVVIVSETLVRNFSKAKATVIGLKNILSKKEMKEKLQEAHVGE
ncbi:MAG: PTS sugar transporter subunit IIB [Anaerorhabdus sp.]|uniref:PTS sugar transporter subunit IIB n=1 Tax=Anaerorhabdus sp. TaxID=1872524 RepID=UPI003A8C1DCF